MTRTFAIALVVVVLLPVAGCSRAPAEEIRIGVLSVCRGTFASYYEGTLAGAELALIRRGGRPAGSTPDDGVVDVEVGGRNVELRFGCSDDTAEQALEEARRLVEVERVDALVGPFTSAAGIAIRSYAKTKPSIAFLNGTSPALEVTLKQAPRNLFRFNTNAVQWTAGLGTYAFRELGWRTAVVVGSDFTYNHDEAAGFVAEFCALGGRVVERTWTPIGAGATRGVVRSEGIDGHFLSFLLGHDLLAFVAATPTLPQTLGGKVLLGAASGQAALEGALGSRSLGVVFGSPLPIGSTTPGWVAFQSDLSNSFPKVSSSPFALPYFNAMEATLRGLEAVDGDLTDRRRFIAALARVTLEAPNGHVELDARRQAIAPNYLVQVQTSAGGFVPRTIRTVRAVDDSYGGRFTPSLPLPSRSYPVCRRGSLPSWARG